MITSFVLIAFVILLPFFVYMWAIGRGGESNNLEPAARVLNMDVLKRLRFTKHTADVD